MTGTKPLQVHNLGRFQYTGQVWLGEAGLYYYCKTRMYSPTLGRFMQTDPIGYGDGMNWYNYVGGDPGNGTDPSGNAQIVNCNWSACSTGHIGGIGTGTGSTGSQPPTITSTTSNGDGTGSWTASDGSSGTYDGVANTATINSAYGPVTYSGSTGSFDTIFVTAPTPYHDPWGGKSCRKSSSSQSQHKSRLIIAVVAALLDSSQSIFRALAAYMTTVTAQLGRPKLNVIRILNIICWTTAAAVDRDQFV